MRNNKKKRQGKKLEYRGLFGIRRFFMTKMPRLFAKWYYSSFKRSREAFRMLFNMRGCTSEYWYARYVNSYMIIDEDFKEILRAIARWIRKEKEQSLLEHLCDIFTFRYKGRIEVYLVTSRPGLWIGRGGETIESLIAYLREQISEDITVELKEWSSPATKVKEYVRDYSDFYSDDFCPLYDAPAELMGTIDDVVDEQVSPKPFYELIPRSGGEGFTTYLSK